MALSTFSRSISLNRPSAPPPGIAAECDQLLDQHAGGGRRLLRQVGDLAGIVPIAPGA
jgi:hypothetical protein